MALTTAKIEDIQEELYKLEVRMEKTSDIVRLPLAKLFAGKPKALVIQYLDHNDGDSLILSITNQHVNRQSKVLAKMDSIDKKLCFNSCRHTFNPTTQKWTKRDTSTGRFIEVKHNSKPLKVV